MWSIILVGAQALAAGLVPAEGARDGGAKAARSRLLGCHDLVRRRELLGGGVEGNEETCDTYE